MRYYQLLHKNSVIVAYDKKLIRKFIRTFSLIDKLGGAYPSICKNIRTILIFPGKDYYTEVFTSKKIWMCQPKTVRESSLEYLASLVIHEAWHIVQHARGVKNISSRGERGAYLVQRRFLELAKDKQSLRWLDKAYKEKWWIDADENSETRPSNNQEDTRSNMLKFLKQYKNGELQIIVL